jgi:hypothetical protein
MSANGGFLPVRLRVAMRGTGHSVHGRVGPERNDFRGDFGEDPSLLIRLKPSCASLACARLAQVLDRHAPHMVERLGVASK